MMLARMWRKRNTFALLVGMQTDETLWKIALNFQKKLKLELPYDPAIALLSIYPRDTGMLFQRGMCLPMFTAALLTTAKLRKDSKCPLTDK